MWHKVSYASFFTHRILGKYDMEGRTKQNKTKKSFIISKINTLCRPLG